MTKRKDGVRHDPLARIALVTGASRGIGEAIARRLAGEGWHVGLVGRGKEALDAVVEDVCARGGQTWPLVCDVTDREASARVVQQFTAEHGAVSLLVNNAGGNVRKRAEAYALEEWDALLALALTAPFQWSRLVYPGMRALGLGRIVNISSVAGMTALPTGAPYAAAKAGVIQLTKSLAREWGRDGITVNAIAPWYVRTPLTEGVLGDPAYLDEVMTCTPVGRLGTPDDVAAAVAFLAGAEASWMSGVCLPLDGGFTSSAFFPPA